MILPLTDAATHIRFPLVLVFFHQVFVEHVPFGNYPARPWGYNSEQIKLQSRKGVSIGQHKEEGSQA